MWVCIHNNNLKIYNHFCKAHAEHLREKYESEKNKKKIESEIKFIHNVKNKSKCDTPPHVSLHGSVTIILCVSYTLLLRYKAKSSCYGETGSWISFLFKIKTKKNSIKENSLTAFEI